MRIIAIDYGEKRIGLAVSDAEQRIAFPLKTLFLKNKNDFHEIWRELLLLADKYNQEIMILLGNPTNLNNRESKIQNKVMEFSRFLQNKNKFRVKLYDEKFTSIIARNILKNFDVNTKTSKKMIDATAATVMLQEYLDLTQTHSELS